MLMALNRRVLDVTGRLSLMAPQPEVTQILKRAGIHNILRIFETETELIKSSEDIIMQTSSIKLSDVNAALKQAPPQSEFDQLRSEIGSVFGDDDSDSHHAMPEQPAQQQSRQAPAQHHGHEDEFDQMFQQFEHHGSNQQKPAGYGVPPVQPQSSQQMSQFQPPRQFSQPSGPQPIPMRPSAPATPRQPVEPPKFQQDFSTARSETQKFPTVPTPAFEDATQLQVPPPRKALSLGDDDTFDRSTKSRPASKATRHDDFDSFDDDSHDEFKKKSAAPVLIIAILVIVLLGGGLAAYLTLGKKEAEPVATAPVHTPAPAVVPSVPPQVPVDTPPAPSAVPEAQAPAIEAPEPPAPEKEIVESQPEVSPPPVRKATPRKEVRRAAAPAPKPELPPKQPEVRNQIVFSSSPSGASILINGQNIGTTPFTWTKPFFGSVNVQISKPGYAVSKKTFEFTGGSMNEFYSLEREVVEPPPPPPVVEKPVTRPEPVQAAAAPAKRTPPPPPSEDEDLFDDIGEEDDNFALDEPDAPVAPPRPPVARPGSSSAPATSSMPSRPAAASSSMSGEALIFIASIPPVADVYIGDKLVGKTNVSELKLPAGSQTLRFVKGGKEISKELMLKVGKNPSQMVRIP